jgi:hypothetical protein
MFGKDRKEAALACFKVEFDSKLLSGDPWLIKGNPDNNIESLCITSEFACRDCGQIRETQSG